MTDLMPSRQDFLDPDIKAAFAGQVKAGKPLLFMPNDILEKVEWSQTELTMVYKIYMFGILPCGSKTLVILDDVEVYLDIMVPHTSTSADYEIALKGMFHAERLHFTKMETVYLYGLHGFQKNKHPYKRIHFHDLTDRKKVLTHIQTLNKKYKEEGKPQIETASDDNGGIGSNYYFTKTAREKQFNTADWNRFTKYTVASTKTTNCTYVLRVSVNDFTPLDAQRKTELTTPGAFLSKVIDRDNTITMQWDIETRKEVQDGAMPTDADEYTLFNICSVFFWHHSENPLISVCALLHGKLPRDDINLVIDCATEREVLLCHMDAVAAMSPDITSAFNGSSFDWPRYRHKCKVNKLLVRLKSKFSSIPITIAGKWKDTEESVERWCFTSKTVKIDAENDHDMDCVAQFPGILDTDVLPVFLKMYSRAEVPKTASLNYFLASNKIAAKEDMPYQTMFRIHERSVELNGPGVPKYCHCDNIPAMRGCPCCKSVIPFLDYTRRDGTDIRSDALVDYSTDFHADLIQHVDGVPIQKCCCCGKRPRNELDLADVGYYCTIDCVRPQQLYVRRMIVPDKRALSTMSYVSLSDSFYKADGMKVRNLIGRYCFDREMAFSNLTANKGDSEKDHYPGAWVFPPNRGLHSDGFINVTVLGPDGNKIRKRIRCRPITGLDFNSLYPSIMMTNNLSSDMVVYTKEEADKLRAEGYSLHHITPFDYERGAKKGASANKKLVGEGWCVRHNGVFNGDEKNIVEEYVKTEVIEYTVPATSKLSETSEGSAVMGDLTPDHCPMPTIEVVKFPAKTGPTLEQQEKITQWNAAGATSTRKLPEYNAKPGRKPLIGERMGIFPFIVKKLFDMRVPVKKEFVRLGELLEQLEKSGQHSIETVVNGVKCVMTEDELEFLQKKTDAKQKALKILANTFYGESGNFRSSIYELLVAAGVTCAGQGYIKAAAMFVAKLGYTVHYGDTDSAYIACPDEMFVECDAKYEAAMNKLREKYAGIAENPDPTDLIEIEFKLERTKLRVEWWTEQVSITMHAINELKEKVSDHFMEMTGTRFLNMAYEEVLYPTIMTGKKKYYGNDHLKEINFDKKVTKHFIKGIDVIKQGQAPITKQLGFEFMHESILPENERELIDLAEDKIRKFYSMKHDLSMFKLNARYKPNKQNVPVKKFVERMKEMQIKYKQDHLLAALYDPPAAGDKFEYVVVKKPVKYSLQGSKIKTGKGDFMEYTRVYLASQSTDNPMEIDLDYYMTGAVIGLFARFIAYHPNFQPPEDKFDVDDKEQYKLMDTYCIGAASKYLEQLCSKITGHDSSAITQQGRDYRSIYTSANKQIRNDLIAKYGPSGSLFHILSIHPEEAVEAIVNDENSERGNHRTVSTRMLDTIKSIAKNAGTPGSGRRYLRVNDARESPLSMFTLRRIYNGGGIPDKTLAMTRMKQYDNMEVETVKQLYQVLPKFAQIAYQYERNVVLLIDDMRKYKMKNDITLDDRDLDNLNYLDVEEVAIVGQVYKHMTTLTTIYRLKEDVADLSREIEHDRVRIADGY